MVYFTYISYTKPTTSSIKTHGIVCQRPRKLRDSQVCYLREPPLAPFQPIVVQKLLGLFLRNSYNVV